MELEIHSHPAGDRHLIVSPKGSIDSETSTDFTNRLKGLLDTDGGRDVLMSLAGVKYISSSGLGALFNVKKTFDERGASFLLYDPALSVQRVLEISRMQGMLVRPESIAAGHPWHDFISTREEEKRKIALELETKKLQEEGKKKRARSLFK